MAFEDIEKLRRERTDSLRQLLVDFPRYAEQCLKIRKKSGAIEALTLNRAQQHVHERLEAQLAATGKVRAIILKARQQGFSTYIAARFYKKTSTTRGIQTFILTHEQAATDALFSMVERYHKHNPLKPSTSAANAKELNFDRLESGYSVGTAGTKAVGRSKTLQLFHGSEVGFWLNAKSHFAGVVQAIPDLPGTEVVLESTANGVGGEFHERWQQAEAGIGDYIAVFVPWFWSDEYRRDVPEGFELDSEEAEYMELHRSNGLTDVEQMVWRRAKLAELKDPLLFKQEYPATAQEAFQVTGHDSFIKADLVLKARKTSLTPRGPLVCGADPARFGDDRFSVAFRQGRKLLRVESKTKLDVVQGANWLRLIIDQHRPAKMFIDVGGLGAGTVDILKNWGGVYEDTVVAVNFGGAPQDPEPIEGGGYRNRRAEMWGRSKAWLDDAAGVDIPDLDALHADACGPSYKYDANQRILLESKEDMRKRGVRSPDEWDAVALTFAEPVRDSSATGRRLELPSYGVV